MKFFIILLCFIIYSLAIAGYTQNAPRSVVGSVVSLDSIANVPIYAFDFNDISSCNLRLSYDSALVTASGVNIGPGLGGMISTNLSVPGQVSWGWFTSGGVSLPDSSIIFTIIFSKNDHGLSSINWVDNGNSCKYSNSSFMTLIDTPTSNYYQNGSIVFQSPNAPTTAVADVEAYPGSIISIPVLVSNFQMIGSFALNLQYDPSVMTFLSYNNDADFPDIIIDNSQSGEIQIEGIVPSGDTALTLENNASLLTLNFNYLGGFSALNWIDNGTSCEYRGSLPVYPVLNDIPQTNFYFNGSVSESYLPASAGVITGPATVCAGSTGVAYSVQEIAYATDYQWLVPEGVAIISGQNTNSIQVDFSEDIFTDNISVYGSNNYGNGSPSQLDISTLGQPAAAGIINGPAQVCQGQENVIYSIQPIENATIYNWILPFGANITNGVNTNMITVSFSNSAQNGIILVSGSNICGIGNISLPLQLIVNKIPTIIQQPLSPPSIYAGLGEAIFFVEASGAGLAYQWQEFNNSWIDLEESGVYAGVQSDTLKIMYPPLSMNGLHYRCLISGLCQPSIFTNGNAFLTVLLPVDVANRIQISLSAYPNPCSSELTVDFYLPGKGELTINLFSLQGESVLNTHESNMIPGIHSLKLDTAFLKPGLYILGLKFINKNKVMVASQRIICSHLP